MTATFPDIHKRCAIHSTEGSIMVIPSERVSGNKVLTRLYCQMDEEEEYKARGTGVDGFPPVGQG